MGERARREGRELEGGEEMSKRKGEGEGKIAEGKGAGSREGGVW